jgi:hypothetical protein
MLVDGSAPNWLGCAIEHELLTSEPENLKGKKRNQRVQIRPALFLPPSGGGGHGAFLFCMWFLHEARAPSSLGTAKDEALPSLPSQVVLPPELSRMVLSRVEVSKACGVWRGIMARWRQLVGLQHLAASSGAVVGVTLYSW